MKVRFTGRFSQVESVSKLLKRTRCLKIRVRVNGAGAKKGFKGRPPTKRKERRMEELTNGKSSTVPVPGRPTPEERAGTLSPP